MSQIFSLVFLVVALAVLYRFVIPRLFPGVVNKVGIIKLDDNSNEVYAFESKGIPIANMTNRSQVRANVRRRHRQYEAAEV